MGVGFGLWLTAFMIALSLLVCLFFSFTDFFTESVIIMSTLTLLIFIILLVLPREKSADQSSYTGETDWQQVLRISMICLMSLGLLISFLVMSSRWSCPIYTRTRDDRAATSILIPASHRSYPSTLPAYSLKYKHF